MGLKGDVAKSESHGGLTVEGLNGKAWLKVEFVKESCIGLF